MPRKITTHERRRDKPSERRKVDLNAIRDDDRPAGLFSGMRSLFGKVKILFQISKLRNKNPMEKLKSRKLWITVVSSTLTAVLVGVGLDPEVAAMIIGAIISTFNIGQGIADNGKAS